MFKRFWWVLGVMAVIGPLMGLGVAAVISYVMPKKYESEAIMEVKPLPISANGELGVSGMTPQFFGTEFEKIKSHASLAKVVEKLELVNRWGVDEESAIRMLKGMVNTENIRGTDLISIRVRHTDKEVTRDIVTEVARCYRAYRSESLKRGRERGLLELNQAVKDQEDKVEERIKVLRTIPSPIDPNARGGWSDPEHADAKRDLDADQALLQTLKLKQISETISSKMPDESVVLHEEPQIGQAPASPNVTLNLLLGTVLGFLLAMLLALPLMFLLHLVIPVRLGGSRVLAD